MGSQLPARLTKELTDRHLRFVEEYCVDLDKKRAAEAVGVDPEHAVATSWRWMKDPYIQAAIDVRLRELSRQSVTSAAWVEEKLVVVVDRCLQGVPVMEWSEDENGKRVQVPSGEWKFDANGANKALELLGRRHGMFAEQIKITVEHELKGMSESELDARIARLLEERKSIDLVPGDDGTFAQAVEDAVLVAPVSNLEDDE